MRRTFLVSICALGVISVSATACSNGTTKQSTSSDTRANNTASASSYGTTPSAESTKETASSAPPSNATSTAGRRDNTEAPAYTSPSNENATTGHDVPPAETSQNTAPPATSRRPIALAELPDAPPPSEPIVAGNTASKLRNASSCDPGTPTVGAVTLSWQPAGGGKQLIAIAVRKTGFETARYNVSKTLSPDTSSYAVRGVQPGGVYYWRVMTRVTAGWTASRAVTFTGPTCVLDQPSSP